jgi:diguanylate cyclase (GGDEF)-like protein
MADEKPDADLASAQLNLKQLERKVRAARTELRALQASLRGLRSVAAAEQQQQQHLLDANEQLLLSALHAQAKADAVANKLDQLTETMQRDDLTQTPNRALLLDRLESAITLAQRRRSRVALLFLDVDHFKQINDSLGHAAGDAVLQWVARRLEGAVRDSDAVGRHGGDEFLVLLPEVTRMADAALIARKIIADMAVPSEVGGHPMQLSVSVGIAMYPDDALQAPALIALADAAMYRSKRCGGGRYTFHGDAQHSLAESPLGDGYVGSRTDCADGPA